MEELDEFGIPIKKTNKTPSTIDEFGIPIKKKESTVLPSTTAPRNPVSDGGTVSSATSKNKGFPKIDTNSVAPGNGVQPKVTITKKEPKNTSTLEKPKEESSFFDYLKENLDTGLATVSKSIYDTPGLIYDAAASITNPIFKAFGVDDSRLASSDKLANDLGFKNIPSEILKEKIKISNEKINEYSIKNGGDAWQAASDGNYVNAAKLVAGTTMQSLPIMVAAMASGGETMALTAIGVSTASTKNAQLKDEHPKMGLGTRVLNSANSGIIEAVTGHLFTGASGAVMKKILVDKGTEQGAKIISKSLKSTIEKSIEKNPLIGAIGEIIEESAVEFGNQLNDMSSGIRTEFDVHAIKNAGLSATGMGGIQTLGVYGAKGYIKAKEYAKVKATNKEVFKLRSEIKNGNLSPENKAILSLRADRLEAENKKLLGKEIEKAKALPADVKTELNALNAEFEDLKSKFDDIDDADDIPDNLKPAMKEEIKIQATKNQKRKAEILSQNDGIEVDNDFSNFNGVDPDFDLENGKISSLPLKEQDRLNDQALQELTGGDMTIEVTKEQVSQKANEIYENEQNSPTPTPEAQPQAKVQKPSEAEKVDVDFDITLPKNIDNVIISQSSNGYILFDIESKKSIEVFNENAGENKGISKPYETKEEAQARLDELRDSNKISQNQEVSPVEDVVAPSVEKAEPIRQLGNGSNVYFETEKYRVNDLGEGKIVLNIGDNKSELPIANVEFKDVNEAVYVAKKIAEALPDGLQADYHNVDGIVENFKEQYKNEKLSPTNTPTDGNIRPTTPNVGEVRATKQEIPAKESVPSSVDGGESKGDVEVAKKTVTLPNLDDIADFINQTYLNDGKQETKPGETNPTAESNKGTSENSVQENPSVSKGAKKGKQKEIKLDKNGYVIISKKGKTPLNQRKFKGDRKEAASIEPTDAQSLVLSYFANGGKIASAFFSSKGELKARNNGFNGIATKNAQGIDAIAHLLWESQQNKTLKLDTGEIKDAIENVVNSHNNVNDIVSTLLKNYELKEQEYPQDIIDYHQAIQEAQNEENANDEEAQEVFSSLDQLSEAEIIELAESQDKSYEDYLKDLEKRQVTYDLGPFSEQGTIQPNGWILSEKGDLLSPESVSNVKQVNPDVEVKKPISKDTPELKEVNEKLIKANENLRIAKDALARKAKSLDKELVKDNEDIFGERKNQNENKLFDERVDGNARNKATEKERKAIKDAQDEIKALTEAKAKIESGEIVSTKEMDFDAKQQLKEKANAEVDRIAQKVKDLLPGIKDPDLHTQGVSQDQLIDLIASAVKKLISAGIDVNVAITQVVESIKSKFGDIDIDIDAVKERVTPKKEETNIDSKDLESFRDKIKDIPESGIIAKYLSGETIEKVEGETPRNNQEIDVMKLASAGNHGMETVAQAKELFGENYVEKSLEFLDSNNIKAHEKALLYVSLENEMYNRRLLDPENLGLKKLQDLVRKKSQQHLRESSLAINAGRLRAIMKDGYISETITDKLFSSEELANKRKIEKAIQSDSDAINREAERQENNPIDADLEQLISSGVEKQINEIYKKLPSNRKIKADKAITALENIQKRLRSKAYDASIGIPIALIDSGITIIKNSIKAGVNIADAIEIGINHIKEKYGKDWNKEDDFRSDMLDGFKNEGIEIKEPTAKEKTKQQEAKELVKQSLIDAGFGREITVRTKQGKEQRQILDWKKLAGEEGSLDKMKGNVEKSLKAKGYTDAQISDTQKDLKDEYNSLRASIIEKSLNELNNRNTPRKPVNIKTSAKKLAELYNLGLFDKESDTYDYAMNSALGMNQLGQDSFMEAKRLAGKLSELFSQKDKDGNPISQSSLKHGERVINKQIEDLLSKVAWGDSDGAYKAMIITKEFISLAQRNALVSVPQALENTTSGYISRFYNRIGFSIDNIDTKSLAKVRKTLNQMTFKDITLNGGLEFGDVTSPFISKSKAQDFIVNASDSKFYHGLASAALGKAYLESADSMHKSALTEKFFQYNLIKVLRTKGYSKTEAVNYVSEQLTGQTFDNALVTAKQIIDNINKDYEKKVIPDTKESIFRFAHNIVREALIQGNKMTLEEVEASLKSAETVAGYELGHEANNVTSEGLKNLGSKIQIKIDRAVKEKDWTTATAQTGASIIVSNVLNPYVGGGTNWAFIALQKSGVPTLSTFYWNIKARSSKIDLTSEQGIKNLEKTLKYQLLAKNANTRLVVGATISLSAFMLMKSTGSDDDLYEWLKKHPWANRYFKKILPPVIQLMLAQKDKKVGEAIAQQMNIKADAFDEGKKIKRVFTDVSSGKVDKALGGIGQLAGSRLSMPIIPWRVARDVKGIYRGLAGLPEIKFDYKTSGFWNGYFQGGIVEQMGLRPNPTIDESKKDKFKESQAKIKEYNDKPKEVQDRIQANNRVVSLRQKVAELENYKRAKLTNTPYLVKGAEQPADLSNFDVDAANKAIIQLNERIEEFKTKAGDQYKEPKE